MSASAKDTLPHHFVQIDEDGYFVLNGLRVADADAGREWLAQMHIDHERRVVTTMASGASTLAPGTSVVIESFDAPLIALDIEASTSSSRWQLRAPYQFVTEFDLAALTIDEWDRFHGLTDKQVPFVLNRAAQARFFDLVDEFDDESFTVKGQRITMNPWLKTSEAPNQSAFWNELYVTEQAKWDMNGPHPSLPGVMAQLKLNRSRILVLGAGAGHDAAWFAQQGHIVTAVDFSAQAIERARARYGHLTNLKFIEADVFHLPPSMANAYDVIFEHTCYCAIAPERRTELMKVWRRALVENGHLFGIFFATELRNGPPFGGSEWELRKRIDGAFRPLYWTRLHDSPEKRLGHELFVYAQKISAL